MNTDEKEPSIWKNIGESSSLGIAFIVAIVLLCLWLYIRQNTIMSRCSRITIAEVIKVLPSTDSGIRSITVKIQFNDKEYIFDEGSGEVKIPEIGERYFIKVACEKPTISEPYWDITVPDTLKYIPSNGWNKIPYGL